MRLPCKPTPAQVRAEVWMSIIHGSRGLIYFVHQFKPTFIEAGLLADPQMTAAVTKINARVQSLAAVINVGKPADVQVKSSSADSPIAIMPRTHDGATYVFAVAMRNKPATATFTPGDGMKGATVEVLGENRTIRATEGTFTDKFTPYAVHLYKIH